jgi:hypothetical protein
MLILEGHHVGRRQVVRDDDQVFAFGRLRRLDRHMARATDEFADDALDDLANVVTAFAQVNVVDLLELRDQHFHLLDDCPFGVAAPLADDLLGRF